MILKVSQKLALLRQWRTMRQSELKSSMIKSYFRDSLVALGWAGRPASAHPEYTGLFQALRFGVHIYCYL